MNPWRASTAVPASAGRRKGACGIRRADAARATDLGTPLSSVVGRCRLGRISSGYAAQFFKFALQFGVVSP
jgi:hypothetical protein